jgi:U3 small nucleolar RNA-associated protein 14
VERRVGPDAAVHSADGVKAASASQCERGGLAAVPAPTLQDALQAAFAGDDVVGEFEREKAEAVQESAAGVEDPTNLPGWGGWASNKREPAYEPK